LSAPPSGTVWLHRVGLVINYSLVFYHLLVLNWRFTISNAWP
jgi:hypothetical protein